MSATARSSASPRPSTRAPPPSGSSTDTWARRPRGPLTSHLGKASRPPPTSINKEALDQS